MCVILEADFIVGLTIKGKSVLNNLFHLGDELEFSISDCFEMQKKCKTSGWGNVIAESTENDFVKYIRQHKEFFALQPNGNYRVLRKNIEDKNSGEIDYECLLTLGIYNGTVLDAFNYPRRMETIA